MRENSKFQISNFKLAEAVGVTCLQFEICNLQSAIS